MIIIIAELLIYFEVLVARRFWLLHLSEKIKTPPQFPD